MKAGCSAQYQAVEAVIVVVVVVEAVAGCCSRGCDCRVQHACLAYIHRQSPLWLPCAACNQSATRSRVGVSSSECGSGVGVSSSECGSGVGVSSSHSYYLPVASTILLRLLSSDSDYLTSSTFQRAAKDRWLKMETQLCTTKAKIPLSKAFFPVLANLSFHKSLLEKEIHCKRYTYIYLVRIP